MAVSTTGNKARTVAVGGIVTALVLGGGGIALASSQTGTSNPATAASSTTAPSKQHRAVRWMGVASRIEHGQFVVHGKNGTVTRDIIHGTVVAVSPSSITVRAADGTQQTYAVTSQTKVRQRAHGKGTASSISAVAVGDQALVLGTGSGNLSANRVIDVKR